MVTEASCGRQVFSVSCVRWYSATNQRSALTTSLRIVTPDVHSMVAKERLNARFAAKSSPRSQTWSDTCRQFTALVTSRHFSVTSACVFSNTSNTYNGTWFQYTKYHQKIWRQHLLCPPINNCDVILDKSPRHLRRRRRKRCLWDG